LAQFNLKSAKFMKAKRLKVIAAFPRLTITALLLPCLLSTLLPVSAIASALGIGGAMACCRSKSAGHCHAGLKIKKQAAKSEVMCGLKAPATGESTANDEDAQSTENEGLHFASISDKCSVDCGSCAVRSTEQQKRAVALAIAGHTSHPGKRRAHVIPRFISKARFEIEPFSARGPPSDTTRQRNK
jgi:hypothetical protein